MRSKEVSSVRCITRAQQELKAALGDHFYQRLDTKRQIDWHDTRRALVVMDLMNYAESKAFELASLLKQGEPVILGSIWLRRKK